jgi:hypothetical protein
LEVIRKLTGTSQKVRRAHLLLKADAVGPAWTDRRIAEAFDCRTKTVENLRQRFVEQGFEHALERKKVPSAPANKLLDGEQQAKIIATRLGPPPQGYAHWTLRLLAGKVVELEIVETFSHETVRQALKRRDDETEDSILGDPAGGRRRVCRPHGERPGHLGPQGCPAVAARRESRRPAHVVVAVAITLHLGRRPGGAEAYFPQGQVSRVDSAIFIEMAGVQWQLSLRFDRAHRSLR